MALDLDKQQKTMIAVLLSGTILVILNATLLSPALPSIMKDTEVSATTVQWLTSSYGSMRHPLERLLRRAHINA